MIEANHPNACNLCHLNESIEWTLAYLKKWYDRSFNEGLISRSYADREEPVGLGWLKQSHEPTRLVAVEAFGRQQATWGLASILELLDDPYLMNRQFAQTAVESLTGSQLDQRFGYWYYLTRAQREPLLNKIRAELIGQSRADAVP